MKKKTQKINAKHIIFTLFFIYYICMSPLDFVNDK